MQNDFCSEKLLRERGREREREKERKWERDSIEKLFTHFLVSQSLQTYTLFHALQLEILETRFPITID